MWKIISVLVAALSLSSCDGIMAYWAPKNPYTLTVADRRAIANVFGSDFADVVSQHIFTKDLPYGSTIAGMYSPNAKEIWMNENSVFDCYQIAHEATHYYQDNILQESLDETNQDWIIPNGDLTYHLNYEQEAYMVQVLSSFLDGNDRASTGKQLFTRSDDSARFSTYIHSFILQQ